MINTVGNYLVRQKSGNKQEKKRGSEAGRSKIKDHQRTVNLSNLIRINSDELQRIGSDQKTIKLSTINVQSVKTKI